MNDRMSAAECWSLISKKLNESKQWEARYLLACSIFLARRNVKKFKRSLVRIGKTDTKRQYRPEIILKPGMLWAQVTQRLLVHVEGLPLQVQRLLGPQDIVLALGEARYPIPNTKGIYTYLTSKTDWPIDLTILLAGRLTDWLNS